MNYTKVLSRTIKDDTGNIIETPTLLVDQNGIISPLWSLHEYLLKKQAMSQSKRDKLIQAVSLLIDYMEANYLLYDKPEKLFASFAEAVYSGTIDENGNDPSGLYWLPKRIDNAGVLLYQLSEFSDWMYTEYGTKPLNPWREATKYEERLNWAAFINKSQRSFLGHLDDLTVIPETAKKVRVIKQRRPSYGDRAQVKFFPEDKIFELLFEGFKTPGKEDSSDIVEKYNWRDIAITILLHGGNKRLSEPFHLWINDIQADPLNPEYALVRIYHPEVGMPPKDLKTPDGRYVGNRAAYLQLKYGLKPRNRINGLRHAGWKNPRLDDDQQNFMYVNWFPSYWGKLFLQVWKMYLWKRMREKIPDTHPFAFVSFRGDRHGEMYTIKSFEASHKKAVEKIGLIYGKMLGTTPHGHRHAYGQLTQKAGVDRITRQRVLHHKAPDSQDVYTEPSIDQVTKELAEASKALENGNKLPMNIDIDAFFNQERKLQKRFTRGRGKY